MPTIPHLREEQGPVLELHHPLLVVGLEESLVLNPSDELHLGIGLDVALDDALLPEREVLHGGRVRYPRWVWKNKSKVNKNIGRDQ